MRVWRYCHARTSCSWPIAVGQFAATTAWALAFQRSVARRGTSPRSSSSPSPSTSTRSSSRTISCTHRSSAAACANRAFAIVNSANLFLPQVLYKYHHLTHHQYANDPVRNGTTLDPSSTYRYGRNGRQEGFCQVLRAQPVSRRRHRARVPGGDAARPAGAVRHGVGGDRDRRRPSGSRSTGAGCFWLTCRRSISAGSSRCSRTTSSTIMPATSGDRFADSVSYYGPLVQRLDVQRGLPSGTSPEAASALDAPSGGASGAPVADQVGRRLRSADASPSRIPRLTRHDSSAGRQPLALRATAAGACGGR